MRELRHMHVYGMLFDILRAFLLESTGEISCERIDKWRHMHVCGILFDILKTIHCFVLLALLFMPSHIVSDPQERSLVMLTTY